MLDVEFYRQYNGLRASDLMMGLCRDFHKSLPCFVYHFVVIFYCPYSSFIPASCCPDGIRCQDQSNQQLSVFQFQLHFSWSSQTSSPSCLLWGCSWPNYQFSGYHAFVNKLDSSLQYYLHLVNMFYVSHDWTLKYIQHVTVWWMHLLCMLLPISSIDSSRFTITSIHIMLCYKYIFIQHNSTVISQNKIYVCCATNDYSVTFV